MSEIEVKGVFSIRELERLTGIKAHTLRVWEQRYGIIKPKRTESNIRYYNEDHLKAILNIALLNANGIKISKIAAMSHAEIHENVLEICNCCKKNDELLNALTLTMLELDEDRFEQILSNIIIKFGFENAVIQVVYPFLERIGILWQTNTIVPAQEHFISNLVRHKLIAAADSQIFDYKENAKKFVLFLPECEYHEIGLLFANYLIKKHGHRVVYLGQTVPCDDLLIISRIYKADIFLTVLTFQSTNTSVSDYLNKISTRFNDKQILVAGNQLKEIDVASKWKNVMHLKELVDLENFLNEIED